MLYIKNNVITSCPSIPYVSNPSHNTILSNGWEVYEPAVNDTQWPTLIRITAPATLADERPELLLYLYKCERVRGLPIDREGDNVVIYCNEIVEADIPALKSDSRIQVEGRDEEALEYLQGLGLPHMGSGK